MFELPVVHSNVSFTMSILMNILFVWVEALSPSQQFFSHVRTEPLLPGYYQYFFGGKCILLKDTTRRPELGSNPRTLAPESDALPLGHVPPCDECV